MASQLPLFEYQRDMLEQNERGPPAWEEYLDEARQLLLSLSLERGPSGWVSTNDVYPVLGKPPCEPRKTGAFWQPRYKRGWRSGWWTDGQVLRSLEASRNSGYVARWRWRHGHE